MYLDGLSAMEILQTLLSNQTPTLLQFQWFHLQHQLLNQCFQST
jgi:hypothetical protein